MENSPILSRLYMLSNNMTLEDIKQKFGDNKKYISLFNHIDKLDGKVDGIIKSTAVFDIDSPFLDKLNTYVETQNITLTEEEQRINEYQEALGNFTFGDGHFELDDSKIEAYIKANPDLADLSTEDMKQFFELLISIDDKKNEQDAREYEQKQLERNPNIPRELALKIGLDEKLEIVHKDGQTYYDIESEDGSKRRCDSEGALIYYESDATAIGETNGYWNTLGDYREILFFDKEGNELGEIRKYNNSNVVDKEYYENGTSIRQMGRTEFNYTKDQLDSVQVNKGLPNAVSLKCEYNENGKVKDFKISNSQLANLNSSDSNTMNFDSPIEFSAEEKQILIDLLNSGATFGEDFSLDMENNQLKVNPIIKNESNENIPQTPESVRIDLLKYAQKGLHTNRDYTVKYKNGHYEVDLNTAKARDYASEETRVSYSRDGSTKVTTTVSGDITTTTTEQDNNKSVQTRNRGEAFLEKLITGDFKGADELLGDVGILGSDFDFYSYCKKYENATGKNLMDEMLKAYDKKLITKDMLAKLIPTTAGITFMGDFTPEEKEKLYRESLQNIFDDDKKQYEQIKNFDISKTEVGNMTYTNSKQVISDDKYIETSNDKKYTVQKKKDSITIEKDGKTYTINLSGINENLQKMLYNTDANVLYRIAERGIKIDVFSDIGSVNPKNVNGYYAPQENTIMLNADVLSGSKFSRTLTHEVGHSFYGANSPENKELEALFEEELEAFNNSEDPFKNGEHSYCATHIFEFVAESYCLLTTGEAKSEYTIAKYFPKTFKFVKKIIEEQTK